VGMDPKADERVCEVRVALEEPVCEDKCFPYIVYVRRSDAFKVARDRMRDQSEVVGNAERCQEIGELVEKKWMRKLAIVNKFKERHWIA